MRRLAIHVPRGAVNGGTPRAASAAPLLPPWGAAVRHRAWSAAAASASSSSSSAWADEVMRGERGVRACVAALLDQQHALLHALTDAQYTFHSTLIGGSVGGHTRHALDHVRTPLEALVAAASSTPAATAVALIRYDRRARQTQVEHDRGAALAHIDELRAQLDAIASEEGALAARVDAAFMLAGDGREFAFASTLARELAFAVHHAIHHSALVKVLLRHHFPEARVPPDYGLAPSTINFQRHE